MSENKSFLAIQDIPISGNTNPLIVLILVFNRGHSSCLFENLPERRNIRVSNIKHYFHDRFSPDFQLFLCSFHFYPLYIFRHCIPCTFFKPSFKGSAGETETGCNLIDRELLPVVLFDKLLRFYNDFIPMIFKAIEYDKWGLGASVQVNHKIFCSIDGHFPSRVFFDQMQ